MKRFLTLFLAITATITAAIAPPPMPENIPEILILSKTDGCNNFGGHNKALLIAEVQSWAASRGWGSDVMEADHAHYTWLDPNSYCMIVQVYVSGDDVVVYPGESQFWKDYNGQVLSLHSGPDAERHYSITSCDPADADTFYSEEVIGASLPNGGCWAKHECSGNSEVIYKDPINGVNHPMIASVADSVTLNQLELYNVGPSISGGYWNPGNVVLARAAENGSGTEDIPVLWITPSNHVTLTLGHYSNITVPGEISHDLAEACFNYMADNATCAITFPIEQEPTLPQPIEVPENENAYHYKGTVYVPYEQYDVIDVAGNVVAKNAGDKIDVSGWLRGAYIVRHPKGRVKLLLK